jgi:elongator complex protein 1
MLVPYETDALTSLANSLAENLVELKDYAAAATIHKDFLSDVETAAKLFCKGFQFSEAMRLLALNSRQNLFPDIIDAGLVDASASITELVADCKSQINAQVPRLRELRLKKEQDPLAFFAGDPAQGEGADIPDNISLAPTDATTAGTFMTRYTSRTGTINTTTSRKTSKNRRREERKRARGKKGSVYEEEYLVNSIGRLVERINDVSADVERLVQALLRREMRERAEAVNNSFGEIRSICEECLPEVYEQAESEKVGEEIIETHKDPNDRPQGGDGVLWDSIQEGKKKREPPVLRGFERLSLV